MTPLESLDRGARPNKVRPLLTPKVPPHSEEAEMSVLGGMMLDARGIYEVLDVVSEDDFYFEKHRIIFKAITTLAGQSRPCDFVTVSDALRHSGQLEAVDGMPYLGQLVNDTPGAANVTEYAKIVRERAVLRGLVGAGDRITELAYRPEGRHASELLDVAEQQLTALRGRDAKSKSQYVTMAPPAMRSCVTPSASTGLRRDAAMAVPSSTITVVMAHTRRERFVCCETK